MTRTLILTLFLAPCAAAPAGAALRDPFVRPALAAPAAQRQAAEAAPPPQLRALILNGGRSLASIDGDVLAAGDVAPAGYTVLRIDSRGALIALRGRKLLLTMPEGAQDKEIP